MSIEDDVRAHGAALGFHRVGIARAEPLDEDHAHYRAFVAAGLHGEMDYLAANASARARVDTDDILLGARSVIVCALAYHRDASLEPQGPEGSVIARYARGADYHNFFRKRVRRMASWLRAHLPGAHTRATVDTAPVLERAWARRAGVGFVGKNGLVIVPGIGSYVLLGEVVTSLELTPDEPMASRCGECTRCLEACPTNAFVAPFVLDARRCVSYLTIEQRGAIPLEMRAQVGNRLFGCDDCQDVCPYNRTAPPSPESTAQFALGNRWRNTDLATLATLDDEQFRALTEGSPLSRPRRVGLARNAIVVMGNTRERRYLPVLREITANDADPMLRETAQWAVDTIEAENT